ncbi:hypothetical protein PsYK624_025760 [Phanerochaete sordida]|uniref:Uncharacterized protein n=1 Tax=Phanerochaete sordida TaxID=48140 RepID=A0A9P3G1F8_9APHY|nr:hypothetical protein PsYK624_025760 [Phanerochaete sordida]
MNGTSQSDAARPSNAGRNGDDHASHAETYEFDPHDKPLHDYVRLLSRAVVAHQKVEKLRKERQRHEALLRLGESDNMPTQARDTLRRRIDENERDIRESRDELSDILARLRLSSEVKKALSHDDPAALLEEVSSLKTRVAEVKAHLGPTSLVDGSEDGEIVERHVIPVADVPMEVIMEEEDAQPTPTTSLPRDVEKFKRRVTQRLAALADDVAKVEGQLYQEKDDYQDEVNTYIKGRVEQLHLQSPRSPQCSANASDGLQQLEADLAATKDEMQTLKAAVKGFKTRAEMAEAENELLRGKNAVLQDIKDYLEKQLQQVEADQAAKIAVMQDEVRKLSTTITQLTSQPPAPTPDLKHLADAILPYARERVREDITVQCGRALGEIQQVLQGNKQEVLNDVRRCLALAVGCEEISTKGTESTRANAEQPART